jgi:hypothetical protein
VTRKQLLEALEDLDKETDHEAADCLLIEYIGDAEIKRAFDSIAKWYA